MSQIHRALIGASMLVFPALGGASADGIPRGGRAMPAPPDRPADARADAISAPATDRRVEALTRLLTKLQGDLDTMQADRTTKSVDLSEAQANLDAAKAALRQMTALAPTTPSEPSAAVPTAPRFPDLSVGAGVEFAGLKWAVQTPRVQRERVGRYRFSAKAGERALFDPPRKIRTELVGLTPFAKGQEIRLTGTFNIDPRTVLRGAEWCSIVQIHQADTKRADGSPVMASPLFSLDLLSDGESGKPYLQVRGETGRGTQQTVSPTRILAKLPDIELGKDHTFDLIVVDGHGSHGRIAVWIDGTALVDRADLPTGYEYVDLLADAYRVNGRPQSSASYLKIGIYAGKGTGDVPPEAVNVALTFAEADR